MARRTIVIQNSSEQDGPPEESYERRFSFAERFLRVLASPSATMKDIGLAPDIPGPVVILMLRIIVTAVGTWILLQKISFVGDSQYLTHFWGVLRDTFMGLMFFSGTSTFVSWLAKSWVVEYACDAGSHWDFVTAASVTGYAYVADLVMGILTVCAIWFATPSFTFYLSSAEVAMQSALDFNANIAWIQFWYTLPFAFLGLAWKSYLGALGSQFGTRGKCRARGAFVVFCLLGSVSVLFSFFARLARLWQF